VRLSKRETACGLAEACKPLNETENLPSRLCRDAKTGGSMEYAHATSRRIPAMKPVGERSREIRMLRSMSGEEKRIAQTTPRFSWTLLLASSLMSFIASPD
jgi:hypothetical protein